MLHKLTALEGLQKLDVEIAELERSGSEYPKRLASLEAQLEGTRSLVDAELHKLAELEKSKKTKEEDLAAAKDRVKKWEARLTEQRTTREYQALAREVDIAKKQNVTLQEEIAELAQAIELQRLAVEEKEEGHKSSAGGLLDEASGIRKAQAELDGRKAKLSDKRAAQAKLCDVALLRRYETIKRKRPTVIAAVKEGCCLGCRIRIPPQMANELRASGNIETCPSCGRMIYSLEVWERLAGQAPA